MATVHSQWEFYDGDDVTAFASAISAATDVDSDGSPWWIEPEPNEVEKRRFRPDREKQTGYMATLSIQGPGKRRPDDPIVLHLAFDRPEGGELTEASVAELLASNRVEVPAGWNVVADWGNGFRTEALDVRPTSPAEIAAFVFGALRALGADLPTGRWRTVSQSLR